MVRLSKSTREYEFARVRIARVRVNSSKSMHKREYAREGVRASKSTRTGRNFLYLVDLQKGKTSLWLQGLLLRLPRKQYKYSTVLFKERNS